MTKPSSPRQRLTSSRRFRIKIFSSSQYRDALDLLDVRANVSAKPVQRRAGLLDGRRKSGSTWPRDQLAGLIASLAECLPCRRLRQWPAWLASSAGCLGSPTRSSPWLVYLPQGPPRSAWPGRLAGLTRRLDRQASKRRVKFCDYRPLPAWKIGPLSGREKLGDHGERSLASLALWICSPLL